MISDDKRKHWRAVTEAATEGEWIGFAGCIQFIKPNDCTPERKAQRDVKKKHLVGVSGPDCKTAQQSADSKFIALSREAMPLLLDEVERWEELHKTCSKMAGETLNETNKPLGIAASYSLLIMERDKLRKEVERLTKHVEVNKEIDDSNLERLEEILMLRDEVIPLRTFRDQHTAQLEALGSENKKLRDCLNFYADPLNWTRAIGPDEESWATVDEGGVARAALEERPKGQAEVAFFLFGLGCVAIYLLACWISGRAL